MRACSLAAIALFLAAVAPCQAINFAKGHCNSCGGLNLAAGRCRQCNQCASCPNCNQAHWSAGQGQGQAPPQGYAQAGGYGGGNYAVAGLDGYHGPQGYGANG